MVEVGAAACSKAAAALGQGTVTDNCYCVLTGGGNALNRMLETGLQVCLKLSNCSSCKVQQCNRGQGGARSRKSSTLCLDDTWGVLKASTAAPKGACQAAAARSSLSPAPACCSSLLQGIEFWAVNTDAQALSHHRCENRMQIGSESTRGLGCGGNPEIGKIAALESQEGLQKVRHSRDAVDRCTSGIVDTSTGVQGMRNTAASITELQEQYY